MHKTRQWYDQSGYDFRMIPQQQLKISDKREFAKFHLKMNMFWICYIVANPGVYCIHQDRMHSLLHTTTCLRSFCQFITSLSDPTLDSWAPYVSHGFTSVYLFRHIWCSWMTLSVGLCACNGTKMRDKEYMLYDVIKWKHFTRYWPFVPGIHRSPGWIPLTKASDAELCCFLWFAPWQTIE